MKLNLKWTIKDHSNTTEVDAGYIVVWDREHAWKIWAHSWLFLLDAMNAGNLPEGTQCCQMSLKVIIAFVSEAFWGWRVFFLTKATFILLQKLFSGPVLFSGLTTTISLKVWTSNLHQETSFGRLQIDFLNKAGKMNNFFAFTIFLLTSCQLALKTRDQSLLYDHPVSFS